MLDTQQQMGNVKILPNHVTVTRYASSEILRSLLVILVTGLS